MLRKFPNPHPEDSHYCFNRAVRYLSLRPRSTKEIEEYLLKKDFTPETVKQTVERLLDLNYLNDEEFGKTFMKGRQEFKGRSKYFIKYELKQKGLDSNLIDTLSNEAHDDLETAKVFVERKRRAYSRLDKFEFQQKMMRLLQSRGFSFDIIHKALQDI